MNYLDLFLVVIIFGSLLLGFRKGIVYMIGSILGIVLGIFLAGLFYKDVSNFLLPLFLGNINLARFISFILILILVDRLVNFIFWFFVKITNLVAKLPLISIINRLVGGLLGVVKANISLGIIFYFLSKYSLGPFFDNLLASSLFVKPLISFVSFLTVLLPEELRDIKSILDFI